MEWAELLQHIPELLLVFIPGYIALKIRQKYGLRKKTDTFNSVLYCILYSFFVGLVFSVICGLLPAYSRIRKILSNNITVKQVSYLCLALLLGYCLVRVPETKIAKKIARKFNNHLSQEPTVWDKALQADDGAWATVYLKNGMIYRGTLDYYTSDPNDEIKEVLLSEYTLAIRNEKPVESSEEFCLQISAYESDENAMVLLNKDDIFAIEIHKGIKTYESTGQSTGESTGGN